jgi:hypothetical protein
MVSFRSASTRKLSDSGAKAWLYHEVKEAHLAKIVKVDLKGELFNNAQSIEVISSINDLQVQVQVQVLESLKIKRPTQNAQMTLM